MAIGSIFRILNNTEKPYMNDKPGKHWGGNLGEVMNNSWTSDGNSPFKSDLNVSVNQDGSS